MREETVSLNNGLPATYRICIKRIHDSGGEVVQHHSFGIISKQMTKKEWTGIHNPNATRRISPAGTKQLTGLGKTQGSLCESSLHFLAIVKMCFHTCSAFSRMHQFPLVSSNILEAGDKTAHIVTTLG